MASKKEELMKKAHTFEDPEALKKLDNLSDATPEEIDQYRHALKSFQSWMDGQGSKSAKSYTKTVFRIFRVTRKSINSLCEDSFMEWVKLCRENLSSNNSMSAALKKFVMFLDERGRRGEPWEKIAGDNESEFDINATKAGRGAGAVVKAPVKADPEPPAKKIKTEPSSVPEESDLEMEKLDASLAAGTVKDLQQHAGFSILRCRSGAAWVVLPDDVLSIKLEVFGPRFVKAGWKSTSTSEKCHKFSGQPDLALYGSGGKLLVKAKDEAVALKTAAQYIDQLGQED